MSRAFSPGGSHTVLVVKPSSLGDIVHTLPAVNLLKRTWPHLKISWIVNTEWSPLLVGNPDLDAPVIFPRKDFRGLQAIYKWRDWLWQLSRIKPDLALDFQGLARSGFIAKISGARSIHCLSDAEVTPRLLSDRVVPSARGGEHAVPRYLKLVADLGVDPGAPLEFPLPAGDRLPGVDLPERYLLLHPFARGENKSLSEDCLNRMFQLLAPVPIVLAGRSEAKLQVPKGCVNLLNKTSLSELIWLTRHAHFTVSVDSGPMHIAAAITSRLLGIHNWTDPARVGPYNPDAWVWKDGAITQMRDFKPGTGSGPATFGLEHVEPVVEFIKGKFSELMGL